ncbi:integrin alpha-E-like, partial [Manis pentadactyla]|uniref:integrin alpha-E-like n=1 Tax=Manis pentadactyla TaxID=143292 RepID=UPI00255C61CA
APAKRFKRKQRETSSRSGRARRAGLPAGVLVLCTAQARHAASRGFWERAGCHGASVSTASRQCLSFQARTVCTQSQESACGSDPVQHVEIWHLVSCAITSDKENITVATELSLSQYKQLRDVTELQILGEISFNKSLYEGLNAENHQTKITVIFLKDKEYSLLLIMASSVGGLLVLILIVVFLFKCGFFKRKYQQLNLESLRKAQLKSENLLVEEN